MNPPDLAELERLLGRHNQGLLTYDEGEKFEAMAFLALPALIECAKALEPFAQIAKGLPEEMQDAEWCDEDEICIQAGSLRRALSALATLGGSHGQG